MKKYPYSKLLRVDKPTWRFLQKLDDSTAWLRSAITEKIDKEAK